jgi:dihydroorotate dehydrogenase electron transfer subunit
MAPLAPFVEEAVTHKASVDLVIGARTSSNILFESRCIKAGAKVHISTDDGTKGFKGLAVGLAESVLADGKFDSIYACGPEKMLLGILRIAESRGLPMQASLERFMKCGIGICDSCAIDGKHVCTDGPVFSERDLRAFGELAKTKLDMCGRKVPV